MIEINCKSCGNPFKVYKYRAKSARYCSYVCKGKDQSTKYLGEANPCWRGGHPNCIECGKTLYNRDARWCDKCSKTEAKHNWKGGISFTRAYFRNYEYQSRARRYNAEGSHTQEEWDSLKKTYHYMCLCCKRYEPDIKLEQDHIIPIVSGGSNYIWNIQPLCRSCNAIKHAQTIDFRILMKGGL